ncbi:protein kinase domain-containing protein [Singulisphaera rosea]
MVEGRDDIGARRTVFGFEQGPTRPSTDRPETPRDSDSGETLRQESHVEGGTTVPTHIPYLSPASGSGGDSIKDSDGASTLDSSFDMTDSPVPGQVLFGRYLVVRQLGEGGMGTVWLVRHLELDSERALKLIVSGIAMDSQMRARFRREARMMDRLNHPSAVRVYDAKLGTGTAFIEMELVRGESLNRVLKPGQPMPIEQVVALIDQLCDVLQAANDEGIIHRDLKPSNLMLVESRVPGKKILKLLDFGIAKFRDGGEVDDITTQTGLFIGTLPYASPEQIRGDDIDTRSDLYSVGVLLYELLTGFRPFSGPPNALIASHLSVAPPAFADKNPDVEIAPEIEDVVMICLAKDAKDRPQSPHELLEMFHEALDAWGGLRGDGPKTEKIAAYRGSRVDPLTRTQPFTQDGPYRRGDKPAETEVAVEEPPVPPKPRRRPWKLIVALGIAFAFVAAVVGPRYVTIPTLKDLKERTKLVGGFGGGKTPEVAAQLELWKARGYTADPKAGQSDQGWPNALTSTDGIRLELNGRRMYLPAGYSPGEKLDPKGMPLVLKRDEDGATFVRIVGGTFRMGNFSETPDLEGRSDPAHPVSLSSFYLQTTEVTNGEVEHLFRESNSSVPPEWKKRFDTLVKESSTEEARKHPAVHLRYELASEYARQRGGRLPTEAQWEYAARSGGKDYLHVWDFGDELDVPLQQLANIYTVGDGSTLNTAKFRSYPKDATANGIMDLTGNVRELCRDVWMPYQTKKEPELDPQFLPDATNRDVSVVVRGGSYQSYPESARTTYRVDKLQWNDHAADIGFRIVLECPELPAGALPATPKP